LLAPFERILQQLAPEDESDNLPFPYLHGYVGRGFVEWLSLGGGKAVHIFSKHGDEVFASTPLSWLSVNNSSRPNAEDDKVTGTLLRRLLRVAGIERLRAFDLQDLCFDEELAKALLSEGSKLQRVRAFDEIHSDSLRDRLKATFGERLELQPLPDYRRQATSRSAGILGRAP